MQHLPSLPVIVALLAAALTSFSRVFEVTRPGWGRLPAWFQTLAPTLLTACGAIVAGLAHVSTGTDLAVVIVGGVMAILPGLPSNRSAAPLKAGKPITGTPSSGDVAVASALASGSIRPKPPGVPPFAVCLCIGLLVLIPGCGLFAAAAPYLAEAAVLIADATNAVNAAESTHLIDPDLIARARAALAAAAKADNGLQDLTAEQLDASLADFRSAWAAIQQVYAAKHVGASVGDGVSFPVPLAIRRTYK